MSTVEYRPAIDGLRGPVAVTAVLLFHLQANLLPGGFVGVDVFFVISGYLITSIIVADCEGGNFRLSRFYQRRISRIFPAFFLLTISVLFAASYLYTTQDFASAGAVTVSSALSLANVKFMLQGNYFELSPDAQPFLHFWSLAVEEQFYLCFPFLVYIAYRVKMPPRLISRSLTVIAAISFLACVVLTRTKPTWAFYLLPTRAWEMLAGCILAISSSSDRSATTPGWNVYLSNVGLLTIVASFVLINEGRSFPGYIAALPVIGTVFVIGRSSNPQCVTERWLSHPVLVFIGKVSYSLYLWHWPVYCFVDYSLFLSSFFIRTGVKVVLSVVLSVAAYFLFERPLRHYLNWPGRRLTCFVGFAVGVTLLVGTGSYVRNSNYVDANLNMVKNGGVKFNANADKPLIVLMGDSNASMYGRALQEIASETGFRVNVVSVSAGVPFPGTTLFSDSLSFLEHEKPDITIFAAAWARHVGNDRAQLELAVSQILEHSANLILITQPPALPLYASREEIRKLGLRPILEDPDISKNRIETNEYLESRCSERIHILDIESLFLKPDGEIRFTNSAGRQLYNDATHLSGDGSELVKEKLLKEISRILASRPAVDAEVRSSTAP